MGREFPSMEDEFELSLELSIGGCYAKSEAKSLEGEKGEISRSEAKIDAAAAENGGEFSDLRRRREMQAMKRREARMKRELKKSRGFVEVEGREREVAAEEPARKREKSFFGENKVSWGDCGRQQQQFLLPVGNGAFACPWVVAGERDEGNSGGEPPGNAAASSHKGGSSSDTGSHSSSFGTHQDDKVEPLGVNNSPSRTEPPCRCIGSTSREQSTKVAAVAVAAISDTSKTGEGYLTDTTCSTTDKPPSLSTPTSSVVNAPPPPKVSNPGQDVVASPPPQMPCVSTTGNGPNGRTITGFLYKYTKSEVSIMCVCHGSFFSPAEFVEHAGGVDVTHPLRHITVVPSAVR